MIINSSTIGMQSTRTYRSVTKMSARGVQGTFAGDMGGLNSLFEDQFGAGEKTAEEDNQAKLTDLSTHMKNTTGAWKISTRNDEMETMRRIRQQCMDYLMNLLFPFHGTRSGFSYFAEGGGSTMYTVNGFQTTHFHSEEENTTFSTQGMVKTADGRELTFNLELGMSRSFQEYYEENYVTSVKTMHDPLVINLDSNIAKVSDQKFFFDLDCDGKKEEISGLEAGSGFLALDLNGDGEINDGSELFGTKSGDGFRDLSRYDADGNGWIDEADPIWEKLLIWTKDEDGKDKLYHLAELGVGAIGLSRVGTQFSLNSEKTNETNAMIRNTGVFLYENGTVSTIQHVDMATYTA